MTRRTILFSLIAVLFLASLPLPWLMQVNAARSIVFSWLGDNLSGEFSADSCSFGWFSGLRCKNFHYLGHDKALVLTIDELRSSKGLLLLLLAPGYLGDINLKEPVITVHTAKAASAQSAPQKTVSRLLPWWNRGSFQMRAQRGQVQLQYDDDTVSLFNGASFAGALENGSLRYILQAHAGGSAEDNLLVEGFLNAPPKQDTTSTLMGTSTIVLKPATVADLPPLPKAPGLLAAMKGTVSGTCRLVRDVDGSLQLQGALSGQNLLLPLFGRGEKQLQVEKAGLHFDLTRQSKGQWLAQQLQFDSDLVSLDARGLLHPEKSDLDATATLNLPQLSEALRLRSTQAFRPDAHLQSGNIQCSLHASGPFKAMPLHLSCNVSDIQARQADALITWTRPLALTVQATRDTKHSFGLNVYQAQLQSAFLHAEAGMEAQGDGTFIRATGDIGALASELGKVVLLPLLPQGKMAFAAARKEFGPTVYNDELNFSITDFTLHKGGEQLFPAHTLSLQANSTQRENGTSAGKLKGTWWPGTIAGNFHDVQGQGVERRGRYTVTGTMLLARLQPLLQSLFPELTSLGMAGSIHFDLAAQLEGSSHRVQNLHAMLNKPLIKIASREAVYSFQAGRTVVAGGEAVHNYPAQQTNGVAALHLAKNPERLRQQEKDQSIFDLQKQSLTLQPLLLFSDGLLLKGGLALRHWWQERPGCELHAHGNIDGAILDTLLRATSYMPAGLKLQGPTQLAVRADYPGKPLPELEFAAQLDSAAFEKNGRQLFHKQALNFYTRLEAADSTRLSSWDILEFSVHNQNFWAQGKGFLWDEGRRSGLLALQGKYLETNEMLKRHGIQPEATPFQLSVPFN
ncbi:MAG: hypothetical protein GX087_04615 [Desulfobulbaceae bacterium]|nr:hypothetical protein [Desulfobulbaceae bacterium]